MSPTSSAQPLQQSGQTPTVDPSPAAAQGSPSPRTFNWRKRYARNLWISDLLVLVWVVFGTQIAWFGLGNADVAIREDSRINEFSYWTF